MYLAHFIYLITNFGVPGVIPRQEGVGDAIRTVVPFDGAPCNPCFLPCPSSIILTVYIKVFKANATGGEEINIISRYRGKRPSSLHPLGAAHTRSPF
jgi:hypothetical protein